MAMELLLGKTLLKGDEEVATSTVLAGKSAIALYFSAHWCPPCRGFTPKFAEFYTADLADRGLEVVFVSSDKDEAGFKDYFKDMPWLALPYSERDLKKTLSKKYKVDGIPSIVILNSDGSVITKDGRSVIMEDPKGENFPWIPPTFQAALGDKFLKGEADVGKEAIEGKTLGLYFSAHWCPPCRSFTPKLAEWYKKMKPDLGDKFEIIFCSGDRDEAAMKSYYKEQCEAGGDWLCLPYEVKDKLKPLFEVSGIPSFIIVDPSGKVINKNGRSLVSSAEASEFPWSPPAVGDLDSPDGINETLSMCLMLESCDASTRKKILENVEPIAKKHSSEDADPQMLFFAATSQGSVSGKIRGMCGLDNVEQVGDAPSVVLMDIPDEGGYYVGKMSKDLDGSSIQQLIDDYKAKKLTRKQLS